MKITDPIFWDRIMEKRNISVSAYFGGGYTTFIFDDEVSFQSGVDLIVKICERRPYFEPAGKSFAIKAKNVDLEVSELKLSIEERNFTDEKKDKEPIHRNYKQSPYYCKPKQTEEDQDEDTKIKKFVSNLTPQKKQKFFLDYCAKKEFPIKEKIGLGFVLDFPDKHVKTLFVKNFLIPHEFQYNNFEFKVVVKKLC